MIEFRRRARSPRPRLLWLLPLALAALVPMGAQAQEGESSAGNNLRSIDYSVLPGNRLEMRFELDQPVAEPRTFTIQEPARIALDLPNTRNRTGKRSIAVDTGVTESINIAESQGRTRVVLNLSEMPRYQTRADGSSIVVTIGGRDGGSTQTASGGDTAGASASAEGGTSGEPFSDTQGGGSGSGQGIEDVNFRRGEEGQGRVVVDLSSSEVPVNIDREGGEIVVELPGTRIPERLRRRLDVLDFATPVKFVDIMQRGDNGRIRIIPRTEDYEQLAYQSDKSLTVELKPLTEEEVAEREAEEPEYTGERLSLNFQSIEVRSVLQLLADFTGLNVVVSDSVGGTLTLRLKNVPWDQALDIILRTEGLAQRRNGNVIFIAPQQEIAQREQQQLEAEQQKQELAPLRTEYIQVNYAKAADLASIMQSEGTSLLSDRASVTVDQRTNTLLVRDTSNNLEQARQLVNRLDVPVRQVLIESRIVVANDDFSRDLGVQFGVSGNSTSENAAISASGTDAGNLATGATTAPNTGDYNVNLPVTNPAGSIGLALAELPFGSLLQLELSAMQAEGRGEIISTPRVITANQSEAVIEQGVEIPYQEASSSGATSVSFKKAVLSLTVTPQITPDDRVIMDLAITRDSVGQIFANIPSIDTRELQTQVLVDNGETVVLGGIYEQDKNRTVNRVPFFSDLPVVGTLFKSTSRSNGKSELLVFVTPKIVKGQAGLDY
ncbi:MAG: type IV pilus secretin PilQ [Halofilum sp. (in: g-proteobacteria)]|nr:type IV pilus secretin PilQ [Halofilum sp. (in: g-proteobacteria)]